MVGIRHARGSVNIFMIEMQHDLIVLEPKAEE